MPRGTALSEFQTGWPALLTATVGSSVGVTALLFYSQGTFIQALQDEFGWSRADISSSFLFTNLAIIISAPVLGWLLDRFGTRPVALVSVPGLSIVLGLLSQFSGSLTLFYALFAFAGLFGAGTSSILYTKAVNSVFFKARGLALGISLTGLGVAALVLPPLMTAVIQSTGWRTGFGVLAGLAILALPFVLFGLPRTGGQSGQGETLTGMDPGPALQSRAFWTILVSFLVVGISVPALIPHIVPMLTDAGLSPSSAAGTASVVGVGVIVGRLTVGYLVDHVFAPFVAAPLFLLTAAGCLILLYGGPAAAIPAAFLIGASFGAEADLIAYLCGHYFGLKSYGFIYGVIYGVFTLMVAIGPIIAGAVHDHTGNYNGALAGVAALLVLGALLILTMPRTPRLTEDADAHEAESRTADVHLSLSSTLVSMGATTTTQTRSSEPTSSQE